VIRALTIFFALLCVSCAQTHKHVAAPSNAAVQGGIDRARGGVTNAQGSNKSAQKYNDISAEDARLIDEKAAVIQKYWNSK
jgi:hypothetical protein